MRTRYNGVEQGGGGGAVTPEAVGDAFGSWIEGPGVADTVVDALGAVPEARTLAGLDLSSNRAAAALLAALTAREALPDTGWTDAGTGTASHAAGVHTLSIDPSEYQKSHRASIATPECPAIEICGRLLVTTGVPATDWWSGLELRADDAGATDDKLIAQVTYIGALDLWQIVGGSATRMHSGSGGEVNLTSGTAWVKLVVTPRHFTAYRAVGSSLPTSWTRSATIDTPTAPLGSGTLSRVGVFAGRNGSGSGAITVEWRDLSVRLLGLAP